MVRRQTSTSLVLVKFQSIETANLTSRELTKQSAVNDTSGRELFTCSILVCISSLLKGTLVYSSRCLLANTPTMLLTFYMTVGISTGASLI